MSIERFNSEAEAFASARAKAGKLRIDFQIRQSGKLFAVGNATMLPHHFFTSGDGGTLLAIIDETGARFDAFGKLVA